MSEAISLPARECNGSMIDIPSVAEAMSVVTSEILNASRLLSKIQDATISLEEILLYNSRYVEDSAQHEAAALKQSAHNLECSLELAISEIRERMLSLQVVLNRKAIVPAILSTADDVSVAFHVAVNGPEIDWPLAETVLERFLFLWTEELATVDSIIEDSIFRQNVWCKNNFDSNIARLLQEGDCWRVRKSLELIQNIVGNADHIIISSEIFDSLASILLQPLRSVKEDEARTLVYLIAKSQNRSIDLGISRLIDSFLSSRKGKTSVVCNVLKIIYPFIAPESISEYDNVVNYSKAPKIPNAMVKILIEEKGNTDIIDICLELFSNLYEPIHTEKLSRDLTTRFTNCGICETLISVMELYLFDEKKMNNILEIIIDNPFWGRNISRFIEAGLLKALKQLHESPFHCERFPNLIQRILDDDSSAYGQFLQLGILPESSFFDGVL
jgi:hypothetical protein